MTSKAIHVVYTDDFFPEMWELTYPTIKSYADGIGADLNVIETRRYRHMHPNYEKFQVYHDGAGYDSNFLVDADVLIHPHFPDFSSIVPPHHVGFNDNYYASDKFDTTVGHFERDGRNVGIASNAVITHKSTHVLWKPLEWLNMESFEKISKVRPGDVDEYNLSYNLAKYGIKYCGITWEQYQRYYFVHIGTGDRDKAITQAKEVLKVWEKDK